MNKENIMKAKFIVMADKEIAIDLIVDITKFANIKNTTYMGDVVAIQTSKVSTKLFVENVCDKHNVSYMLVF